MRYALFLALLLVHLPSRATAIIPIFTDVTDYTKRYFYPVAKLKQRAITTGCYLDPLLFCPTTNITRGQAAVLFIRSLYSSGYGASGGNAEAFTTSGTVSFPADVPAGHPQFRWIQQMKNLGFTDNGCAFESYCPEQTHTYAEMAVFLVRGHQLRNNQPLHTPTCDDLVNRQLYCNMTIGDVPSGHWAYWFVLKALDLLGDDARGCAAPNFCPGASVTRGAVAIYLADGLLPGTLPEAVAPVPPGSPTPSCAGTSYSQPTFLVRNNFTNVDGVIRAESESYADPSNRPQTPDLWSLNVQQYLWKDTILQGAATVGSPISSTSSQSNRAVRELSSWAPSSVYINELAPQYVSVCLSGDIGDLERYYNSPFVHSISPTQGVPNTSISLTLSGSFPEPNPIYHRLRLVSGGTTYTISPLSSMTQQQAAAVANLPTGLYSVYVDVNRNGEWVAGTSPSQLALTVGQPPTPLPGNWSSQDIGAGGDPSPGSTTYSEPSSFTVRGSGSAVFNNADYFQFAYTTMSGNATMIARLASFQTASASSKAGIMFRESLTSSSRNVFLAAHQWSGDKRVEIQWRDNPTYSDYRGPGPSWASGIWLKLERNVDPNPSNNWFKAYTSSDGANWSLFYTHFMSMANTVYVGLAVTSENNGQFGTALFDNVMTLPQTITLSTSPAGRKLTIDGTPTVCNPCSIQRTTSGTLSVSADDHVENGNTRYKFAGWSDLISNRSRTITIPAAVTSYTANFSTEYLLTTSTALPNSIVREPLSGDGYYASGAQVVLTAAAATGYQFQGWSGDLGGQNPYLPTLPLYMTTPRSISAVFSAIQPVSHTVKTLPVGISFPVQGAPGGICPGECTVSWVPGQQYLVQAPVGPLLVGSSWYSFNRWSPNGGTASQSIVAPSQSTTFIAYYDGGAAPYQLTLSATPPGAGTVTVSPQGSGANPYTYASPTSVTITATPNVGYVFTGFSGSIITTANSTTPVSSTLMVDGVKSVTANFSAPTGSFQLTTSILSGGGTIQATVQGSPANTNGFYSAGTSVQLIAQPTAGRSVLWEGVDSYNGNTAVVAMNRSRRVTAVFDVAPISLTDTMKGVNYFPRGHAWYRMLADWNTDDCATPVPNREGCDSSKKVKDLVNDDLARLSGLGIRFIHLYIWDDVSLSNSSWGFPRTNPSQDPKWSALYDFVHKAQTYDIKLHIEFAAKWPIASLSGSNGTAIGTEYANWVNEFIECLTVGNSQKGCVAAHTNVVIWGVAYYSAGPETTDETRNDSAFWKAAYGGILQYVQSHPLRGPTSIAVDGGKFRIRRERYSE